MREIVRPKSLAAQARQAIKEGIREGVIGPGAFYSEQNLADRLSVSRTPVREAVLQLSREGLLEVVPQRGFRLREISDQERREVFELRALLEGHVVKKLALAIQDQDLAELDAILQEQTRAVGDRGRFLDADERFHLRLVELAGFSRARDFLMALRDTVWLLGLTALGLPSRSEDVIEEHRAIVEALRRRDGAGAGRAVRHHIRSTRKAIERTSPV